MEKLIAAFATDDGEHFISRHFGDARYYDLYEIDKHDAAFIKRIENTVDAEDEIHADPAKAGGISRLLLNENVSIVVSKVFGPNIKRIRKKFVCIVAGSEQIGEGVTGVCGNIGKIYEEWEKGEDRSHLRF